MASDIANVLRKLEEISERYWEGECELSTNSSPREQVILFLKNYAYERNVSVEKYKEAAEKVMKIAYDEYLENKRLGDDEIEQEYIKHLEGDKPNKLMEGAKPNKLTDVFIPRKSGDLISIHDFISNFLKGQGMGIQQWVKDELLNGSRKEGTIKKLQKLRGIGEKISKLYIRDVVYTYNIEDKIDKEYRHILHPVDVWVERGWKAFKGIPDDGKHYKAEKIAKELVNMANENNVSNTKINAGIFFYGAKICENRNLFRKSLSSHESMECILNIYDSPE